MILVTDSNLIFSALISPNGIVASVFKEKSQLQFLAPDYLKEEVKFHWKKIATHTSLSIKELNEEWRFLQNRIKFIDAEVISDKIIDNAYEIVNDIDPKDILFVALHFYTKHKLWTSDKVLSEGLKAKGFDICITTEELRHRLYKK